MSTTPNAINWFEIPVTDLDRAMTFYAAVTARKLQRMDFGVPGQEEAVFETSDQSERTGSLVRSAQLDRYLSAHRTLASGTLPGAGSEHRVHIVFEGQ